MSSTKSSDERLRESKIPHLDYCPHRLTTEVVWFWYHGSVFTTSQTGYLQIFSGNCTGKCFLEDMAGTMCCLRTAKIYCPLLFSISNVVQCVPWSGRWCLGFYIPCFWEGAVQQNLFFNFAIVRHNWLPHSVLMIHFHIFLQDSWIRDLQICQITGLMTSQVQLSVSACEVSVLWIVQFVKYLYCGQCSL